MMNDKEKEFYKKGWDMACVALWNHQIEYIVELKKKFGIPLMQPLNEWIEQNLPNSASGNSIELWIKSKIDELSIVEGCVVDAKVYHNGALSLKFKSGNCYTIGISKQSQVKQD